MCAARPHGRAEMREWALMRAAQEIQASVYLIAGQYVL